MFRSTVRQVSSESTTVDGNSRSSRRRGASLVEFALCFTLFFVITVVGTMDLGRAVWAYNIVAHASHQAVRYAIVHGQESLSPASSDDIQAVVEGQTFLLDAMGGVTVTTTWDPYGLYAADAANAPGSTVRVRVEHTFTPLLASILGSDIPLASTAEMTISN